MGVGRGVWEEMSVPEEGKIVGNSNKPTGGHFGILAGKRQASCLTDFLSLSLSLSLSISLSLSYPSKLTRSA